MEFQKQLECTDCRGANAYYGGTDLPYDEIPLDDIHIDYQLVTCYKPGMCPDGVVRSTCQWRRYLFFACFDGDPVTYRWESNSLPNHCYYGNTTSTVPLGSDSSFQAYSIGGAFNLQVEKTQAYNLVDAVFYNTVVKTQTDYDLMMCNPRWTATTSLDIKLLENERTYYDFVYPIAMKEDGWGGEYAPLLPLQDSDQVVGMAINGVFIFSGTTPYGFDAFFPRVYGSYNSTKSITPDFCLGTSEFASSYRYYMFSPCLYPTAARTYAAPCDNDKYPTCNTDPVKWALSFVPSNKKNINPIGIAKDGRMIYGPYN